MKKISYCAVSALTLVMSQSVVAYESQDDAGIRDDRQSDGYKAKGIRVGSFVLNPMMSIGNEYNSNIFKQDEQVGEVDSYIAHFKPGFKVKSDWNRHMLGLSVDTDIALYSTQGDANDYEDIFLRLDGRIDVLRDSYLDASFTFDDTHEDRGSPDQRGGSTPTFYDRKAIDLAYSHKFNRVSINPTMNFSRYDYEDTPTTSATGNLRQSTRSRWEYTPSLRVGYEIQPEYEAFAKFVWKEVTYDTGVISGASTTAFDRDSSGYNALAGMAFELTDLVTGDVSVGYLHRDYAAANLSTISGINGFVNLTWRPTTLTNVTFAFSRDINETTQSGVSGVVASTPSIRFRHELKRNVILDAGIKYAYNEYDGFNPANTVIANRTDRLEDVFGGNLGVKYLLNRNFSLGLSYSYDSRDVNYNLSDYEVHQVMFNVNGQI